MRKITVLKAEAFERLIADCPLLVGCPNYEEWGQLDLTQIFFSGLNREQLLMLYERITVLFGMVRGSRHEHHSVLYVALLERIYLNLGIHLCSRTLAEDRAFLGELEGFYESLKMLSQDPKLTTGLASIRAQLSDVFMQLKRISEELAVISKALSESTSSNFMAGRKRKTSEAEPIPVVLKFSHPKTETTSQINASSNTKPNIKRRRLLAPY